MGMTQSYGEVRFSASRQDNPVEGVVIGSTIFASSGTVDPNGGIFTSCVTGYLAPASNTATIASAAARVMGGVRWDYGWVTGNRQAAANDTHMAFEYNRQIAALGQKMLEDRDAANQRIAEGRGHVLSGTTVLQGPDGQRYQAKAGSNYYSFDAPNETIIGRNVWENPIDLQPLAIVP